MTIHDFPVGPVEEVPDTGGLDDGATDKPPNKVHECAVCGVELEYSGRGRPPTRCPEHKNSNPTTATAGSKPRSRNTRADREAAEIATRFRQGQQKLGLVTAAVEPYDGMVLFTSAKPIWKQGEAVLASNDVLRSQLMQVKASGSLGAFILTVLASLALPIAAHHKLIPATVKGYPIGEALESLPRILAKLEAATEEAGAKIAEEMARQEREARERKEKAKAAETTGPVGASV